MSEELSIRLGGEKFGEVAEVGVGGLTQGLIDSFGQFGLLGGELRVRHGSPPCTDANEIGVDASNNSVVRNFPPTIETLTHQPGFF